MVSLPLAAISTATSCYTIWNKLMAQISRAVNERTCSIMAKESNASSFHRTRPCLLREVRTSTLTWWMSKRKNVCLRWLITLTGSPPSRSILPTRATSPAQVLTVQSKFGSRERIRRSRLLLLPGMAASGRQILRPTANSWVCAVRMVPLPWSAL